MLSLEQICLHTLIKYRQYIGDVGSLPLYLLDIVLEVCTAADLERIEEETRAGGRQIDREELQVYWRRLYETDFGKETHGIQAEQQDRHAGKSTGIWKERYLAEKKELDEKMARVGKKVRGMWESEERKKQLRSIQVIEKVPHNKTRKMDAARALCSSSSRARLAKKLRINPVSYRAPTSSQASVTRGRQDSTEKSVRGPANCSQGPLRKVAADSNTLAEHGPGANASTLLDVDIDW